MSANGKDTYIAKEVILLLSFKCADNKIQPKDVHRYKNNDTEEIQWGDLVGWE